MKKRAILIAGPTASGKSETAMTVARAQNGVIINADSMQVYAGLPILTALPPKGHQEEVPHKLYGFREPQAAYSVAEWLGAAGRAAEEVWAAGQCPIFVGGTGLYLKGLIEGIAPIPEVPEHIRLALEKRLQNEGLPALYAALEQADPAIAKRLKPNDKQRILRALMVFEASGEPLSFWQAQDQFPVLGDAGVLKIVLQSPPEELNNVILGRLTKMVDAGVLNEVRGFNDLKLPKHLPASKVLGLRPFQAHIKGEVSLNEAIEKAMIETRQYAKRQRTWFRNQFSDWHVLKAGPDAGPGILSLAAKTFRD